MALQAVTLPDELRGVQRGVLEVRQEETALHNSELKLTQL